MWKLFVLFLFIRLFSVWLIQSWFVPDEYWQSLEIAHKLTYGYGYMSWEWITGIRSYIYPLIINSLYFLLKVLKLDTAESLIYGPRVLQSFISAYADLCFYIWCRKSKWAIFCISTSWIWIFTATRTLSNTLETCLGMIALTYYPLKSRDVMDNNQFIYLIGVLCALRPTGIIMWLPLIINHLRSAKSGPCKTLLTRYVPIALIVISLTCAIDSWCHGSFILTWYNFFIMNIFHNIGTFYGIHPWHWYFTQGFPMVMGIYLIPFLLAVRRIAKYHSSDDLLLLSSICFTIFVFSCLSHKEFRFILPILPLTLGLASNYLQIWSRKAKVRWIWVTAIILLISNLFPAIYFGRWHQIGTLNVMPLLRNIANGQKISLHHLDSASSIYQNKPSSTSFLFLMPCHSTPLYSHLHINVTTRFLTCEPTFDSIQDEADVFYDAPEKWLQMTYGNDSSVLPTHIVLFDSLAPNIRQFLKNKYNLIHKLFHTNYPLESRIGKFVLVYEKV